MGETKSASLDVLLPTVSRKRCPHFDSKNILENVKFKFKLRFFVNFTVNSCSRPYLHDAGEQTLGARAHVHGADRQPQGVDANHHNSSRIHAAHSLAAALGQVMAMVVMPRRSSIRMSLDDNGVLCYASFSATNSPVLRPSAGDCCAAVAPALRHLRTRFAFSPCAIATAATDGPAARTPPIPGISVPHCAPAVVRA